MKKAIAAILAALMVFAMLPTGLWAEENAEMKVYLNGIQTGASTYYSMVQYVPIVRALGYETSYDAPTHSVTSTMGDTTIFFVLHSDQVQVTRAGEQKTFSGNGIWVDEIDGSTYINEIVLREVFGLTLRYIGDGIDIYDEAAAVARFKAKIPDFYAFIEAQALPEDYSVKGRYSAGFGVDSNTFGIHLDGAAAGEIALDKKDEITTLDFNVKTDGLMNFFTLASLLGQQDILGEEQFKQLGISLDDPISGSAYYDGQELLVKSESLVPVGMMQYLPWNASIEAKRSAAQNARDKWVKVWMESYAQGQVTQLLDQLERAQDAERLADEMARNILNTSYYPFSLNGEASGSWYAKNIQTLDTLADVLGRAYVIEKGEEGTVCRATLNSEDYRALTAHQPNIFSALFGVDAGALAGETEFELVTTVLCRPDGSQTAQISMETQIGNLPNGLGIQCGTLYSEAAISCELTPDANPFSKPGEYVDFQQVFNDTLTGTQTWQ